MWENTALGIEFTHNFCAGIGLLQLGVALVFLMFKLDIIIYLKVHYPTSAFKITHYLDNIGNSRFIPITSKQLMSQASARL